MTPWSQETDETSFVGYPVTLKERVFICYLILHLPDEAIVELTEDIRETLEYYRARAEYLSREKPKMPPPQVTVSAGETRVRPPFYLPYDED